MNRLSRGKDRSATDAREALRWLDDITSLPQSAGLVQLQGPDQVFETWEQVERFLLPQTLLSMDDADHESDIISAELDALHVGGESDEASMSSSLSIDKEPTTPSSPRSAFSENSPTLLNASPYASMGPGEPADRTARNSADMKLPEGRANGAIPPILRPLFNHVVWLINQEENTDAAFASYILLTNDEYKQTMAQRFGVRAKRLEQLRDTIAREDRDLKNRLQLFKKENNDLGIRTPAATPKKTATAEILPTESASDDEDVVLLKPGTRGATVTPNGQRILDPNEFSRGPAAQQSPRGGRGGRGSSRGAARGSSRPSTANGTQTAPPAVQPVPKGTPRGPRVAQDLTKPIDPDSFSRPSAQRSMRGGRRKLWEPT